MREPIMDNGNPFGAHRKGANRDWDSRSKRHIESYGIKPISTRVKHPQTNGKIEKFFDCYHRYKGFESLDAFIEWYNIIRPCEGLDTKWYLQMSEGAFWSGLLMGVRVDIAAKLFGLVSGMKGGRKMVRNRHFYNQELCGYTD
jgi:putative transposase